MVLVEENQCNNLNIICKQKHTCKNQNIVTMRNGNLHHVSMYICISKKLLSRKPLPIFCFHEMKGN